MIFGRFYHYTHRLVHQQFEGLYCPIVAVILLAVSFLVLLFKKDNSIAPAKIFFAAGVGVLGFGLFRTVLTGVYSDNLVWFVVWEETTELVFVAAVCCILFVFRRALLGSAKEPRGASKAGTG